MAEAGPSTMGSKPSGRSIHGGGPKIKKVKSVVALKEKQKQGKTVDLSIKQRKNGTEGESTATEELLTTLPPGFKDGTATEELRRLDLTGQTVLFKNAGLSPLRFAGGTLTWLNLTGMDCSNANAGPVSWMWLKLMKTLFVLTMMKCNLDEIPKEITSVTSLKAFVASHNKLSSPSLVHLAPLKDLNSLILSDNELTSFPSATLHSLTSLKKLSLANNKLSSSTLPDFAPIGTVLEEVRLNGNEGITSIPQFSAPGQEASCSLSVLELSHTNIKDLKEIKKLQSLPKLHNLGLRDTPLSKSADYRDKVIELLPQLRILDNIRFDPLFLARKAKGKEPEPEDSRKGKRKFGKQDKGWSSRITDENTDERPRKRKADAVEEDRETPPSRKWEEGDFKKVRGRGRKDAAEPEKRPARREREERAQEYEPEPEQYQDQPHVPKRKQKKKKKAANEPAPEQPDVPMKAPKSIGGSLSEARPEGNSADTARKSSEITGSGVQPETEIDLVKLAKKSSAVAAIVEVAAPTKKVKPRPHKGGKRGDVDQHEQEPRDKPDVLALLAQESQKATAVAGWD